MSQSPSELSDEALIAMLQASQQSAAPTKISTRDVFRRLEMFNDFFSGLVDKPDVPALIYRDADCRVVTWKGIGERLVVGRSPELDAGVNGALLRVDDEEMSRLHFQIERTGDGTYVITDLESTNGLFINGSQEETAVLVGATEIRAGKTTFVFTGD